MPLSNVQVGGGGGAKERMRESTSKRYKNFHIPWEWMLDIGIIGQVGST